MNLSAVKTRVDELLTMSLQHPGIPVGGGLLHGTLGVMQVLYGPNSSQEQRLLEYNRNIDATYGFSKGSVYSIPAMKGVLISIKAELDAGFIGSIRASLVSEILTGLIKLGRATLEESGDGAKNVAAVLTAAAFEDVMRKLSDLNGLPEHEKLQDVLIALKDKEVLQRTEVGTAQSYLSFRNNALHARWSEVDRPVVQCALGFTEQIILKHFT